MDDKKLIRQIQRGDTSSAEQLVQRYYPAILRYCSWHCPCQDRAEDLTQETFLRVFRNIPQFDGRGSFKCYLYTVAYHLCIDECRRQSTLLLSEELLEDSAELRQVDDREQLRYLLGLLTPAQRQALLLHCGQQLSFREISQILEVPPRTVQSRVRAALAILRKEKL